MAAKSIEFKQLSEVEIESARKESIAPKSSALESGVKLVFGCATIESVSIDNGTAHACPIIKFYYPTDWNNKTKKPKENAKPHVVFLKAQCRDIRDYSHEIVNVEGNLTAEIRKLSTTHNAGEIIDELNKKIGSLVETTRVDFYSVSRKGETYPTARNGYNWVE